MSAVAGLLLSLTGASALAAAAADKPPPVAQNTAVYAVTFDKGLTQRIEIRPHAGGRIVLDRFVDDPDLAKREAGNFAGECSLNACRATCLYARNARPFRHITRFDDKGRKLWAWWGTHWSSNNQSSAYELNCSGLADALAPNGHYLSVDVFAGFGGQGWSRMLSGVLRVWAQPDEVSAKGLGSTKDGFVGWKPGAPATIIIEHDAGVVHDGPPEYVETRYPK